MYGLAILFEGGDVDEELTCGDFVDGWDDMIRQKCILWAHSDANNDKSVSHALEARRMPPKLMSYIALGMKLRVM